MPQFDFTTYSAQIFWFFICFGTLLTTMWFYVLPRVGGILAKRKETIDSDVLSAKTLDAKIEEVQSKTEKLRNEAGDKYETRMEEITRNHNKEREGAIKELREKIEEMTKKSRHEIKEFGEKAQKEAGAAVVSLVKSIKTKILG